MNLPAETVHGDLVEDVSEFFAPMASDLVDGLIGQYGAMRARINALAAAMQNEQYAGALHYFIDGNVSEQRHSMSHTVATLFNIEGAVGQLNAEFWNRALRMTDVMDYMPQKRREEWNAQIRSPLGEKKHRGDKKGEGEWAIHPLPDFEENSVRSTLQGLLASRSLFLAERVDGIFKSLSRQHVTNQPQGFSKRMIVAGVSSWGTAGQINDLRCVIAKFMGRDEPRHDATDPVIKAAGRQNGQWMTIDGGALRIRVYGGANTGHLEVHPEMAWRLNAILASLYPMAIPAELRQKPKRVKKIKDFELFDRPLPFAVTGILAQMKEGWEKRENPGFRDHPFRSIRNTRQFNFGSSNPDKATMNEAEKVLTALGGVWIKEHRYWRFDYEPTEVLDQVICSGCIPDHKSHQFYPTPESVAEAAIELADIGPGHNCLEPSAGQGGLADLMPKGSTMCVEISELHCKILEAKGHSVKQADFLSLPVNGPFDRIVMNPPFSEGRWQAHLLHAASMLAKDGRLVAILPDTARNKDVLPGFNLEFSRCYKNEFAGTGVGVTILTATRK